MKVAQAIFCFLLGICSILWSQSSHAGQLHFKLGPTLNSEQGYANKLVGFGYSSRLSQIFHYQLETGAFTSLTGSETYYGAAQIGLVISDDWTHIKYYVGPAYVSQTSPWLGSNFEISNSVEAGIHDSRGVSFGVVYQHFSNAGLVQPNIGRDFITLKIAIPFGSSK